MLLIIIPVSEFGHGGASKAFARVTDGNPVFVLKHNRPSAVIVTPEDYRRMTEAVTDLELYQEAQSRLAADDGTTLLKVKLRGDGIRIVYRLERRDKAMDFRIWGYNLGINGVTAGTTWASG